MIYAKSEVYMNMNEYKKQIGDLFKSKRQEMNLSLKEVENATSIRMLYLKAIEEGNIDKLLSQIYILGFIKQYAAFLGLDGERIIKDYPLILEETGERKKFDYGIGTLEVRNSNSSSGKLLPNTIWIVVGVLALIGAWFFARAVGLF
jgi:cytoskeletal protein RodZ